MNRECFVNGSYLLVNAHGSLHKVEMKDILYFLLQGEYTCIQLTSRKDLLTIDSLVKLEDILPDFFFRINKSVIINMFCFDSYQLSCRYSFVKMNNGVQFSISRRKYLLFKKKSEDIFIHSEPSADEYEPFTDKRD